MLLDRAFSLAALAAATFVFVASAYAQPRAADKPPAAAPAQADHKGMHDMTAEQREQHRKEMHNKMHGDKAAGGKDDHACKGMMGKHKAKAQDDKGHADHVKTAAAVGKGHGCDMGKKH